MIINEMPGLALGNTTADASKILSGYTAYNGDGTKLTGTALSTASTAGAGQIFNGYKAYNNSGTLITGTAMQTGSSAYDSILLTGYTAYKSDGTFFTGTLPNKQYTNLSVPYGSTIDIPYGYYYGSTATAGTFSFSGNAGTGDVASGKTFYSANGTKLTGTATLATSEIKTWSAFSFTQRDWQGIAYPMPCYDTAYTGNLCSFSFTPNYVTVSVTIGTENESQYYWDSCNGWVPAMYGTFPAYARVTYDTERLNYNSNLYVDMIQTSTQGSSGSALNRSRTYVTITLSGGNLTYKIQKGYVDYPQATRVVYTPVISAGTAIAYRV